ncbi:MAG: galactokinase [Spirochaetes bacterium]|nr:galactokinase [Spirochaetota bacterium]
MERMVWEQGGRFRQAFGEVRGLRHFFSPGRVNIIGEHLDYNGGYVFPAALSLGIAAAVRFNERPAVRMRSSGFPGEHTVPLDAPIENDGSRGWWNYPAGVIAHLARSGARLTGADIYFHSTLPDGSGLSSSAAIEVLTAYAMLSAGGGGAFDDDERIRIALLCKKVENEFIGVQCGIMDQFAVAMGKPHHAILLKSDTLGYERVPLRLRDHSLVIMNTNKPRKLSDSKYNERRRECQQALDEISRIHPLASLAEAEAGDIEGISGETLRRRARHVATENGRVLRSVELLKNNDLDAFGRLLWESHRSLRDDYEVTGAELDALVEAAMAASGCIGARMTGAGFGGCAVALVRTESLEPFTAAVGPRYLKATGLRADFHVAEIADGVREILPGGP